MCYRIEDCTVHSYKNIDGCICQPCPPLYDPTACSSVLSHYLGRDVHLLYKGPRPRPAPTTIAFPNLVAQVDYHDGFPLLVASEESFDGVKALAKIWCKEQTKEEWINWDVDSLTIDRFGQRVISGEEMLSCNWMQVSAQHRIQRIWRPVR